MEPAPAKMTGAGSIIVDFPPICRIAVQNRLNCGIPQKSTKYYNTLVVSYDHLNLEKQIHHITGTKPA